MNPNEDLHKHLSPGSEKLKVLHIGNIANNGYNIANLFNQAGVQSDLIIGPYYHIAGCPEWEDSEFEGDIGDQFFPEWHNVKITNGFSRPKWAAQGPWEICIGYLLHRNKGNKIRAKLFWYWLAFCRRSTVYEFSNKLRVPGVLGSPKKVANKTFLVLWKLKHAFFWKLKHVFFWKLKHVFFWKLKHVFFWKIKNGLYLAKYYFIFWVFWGVKYVLLSTPLTTPLFYRLREIRRDSMGYYTKGVMSQPHESVSAAVNIERIEASEIFEVEIPKGEPKEEIVDEFKPDRFSNFKEIELTGYQALADQLKPLFDYYDVIVGYSTDGIWPLLSGKKYVAYEHGTIRALPFEESLQGRLCELVYQQAPEVIISNFDNNLAADKLGLQRYTCIPHYINEMHVPLEHGASIRAHYESTYDVNFIVYNPSRQHWSEEGDTGWEKGNDMFIRGFAKFVKEVNPHAMAIMTHWGSSLDESKQLIMDLGIDSNMDWVEPVPHKQMIQYIHASHVVSDQFLLGTFGGIPAKAFMHGRPVLSSFDPSIHEWCFSEMPPFLPARSVTEIVSSLKMCYQDSDFYDEVAKKSIIWYKNEHSNEVLLTRMSEVVLNAAIYS